jgi:hypothetical protein
MYYWFGKRNKELRSHILEYLNLLTADTKQHPKKIAKIVSIAKNSGMRSSEIKSLINEVDPNKVKWPETNDEQFNQLYYLINLILKDEFFNTEEFDFCIEMATVIGYNRPEAATIVREIYNGIKTEMKEPEIKIRIQQILDKPSINFN